MTDTSALLSALDAVIAAGEGATPGRMITGVVAADRHQTVNIDGPPDVSWMYLTTEAPRSLPVALIVGNNSREEDDEEIHANARYIAAAANLSRHAPALRAMVEENERLQSLVALAADAFASIETGEIVGAPEPDDTRASAIYWRDTSDVMRGIAKEARAALPRTGATDER